ncbi:TRANSMEMBRANE PROTEIN [Salix viminalis]|uniref:TRANSMEMBRANE PROTEIN n=1 Tax=Salix viminalis TaxID=40686 RepID=A0A9Q0Z446_SALVM|nr:TRANSMEMBRANE PROTEIN [Salix viminalis]
MLASRIHVNERRRGLFVSAADNDRLVTDTSVKGYGGAKSSVYDNQLSAVNSSSEDSPGGNSDVTKSRPKRSPLTARERLKAARVLSRNTESKVSKSEMGSKVLDAMRESDKGKKRSGLPEAPDNLFDDSKRGMPKEGWTFQFPGGSELFFIVVSFVLISSIMFATTYIVWKVGAIHFDEY